MAIELASHGIRVNTIAPGYIETDMNREFFATQAGQRLIKRIPQRRLGQVEDLEGTLLLLASDASRYMTGSVITIDGGQSASPCRRRTLRIATGRELEFPPTWVWAMNDAISQRKSQEGQLHYRQEASSKYLSTEQTRRCVSLPPQMGTTSTPYQRQRQELVCLAGIQPQQR